MSDPRTGYLRDAATAAEIERHLAACDAGFVPPLTARVCLADYARKLERRAARFEAWAGGELVGLVAAYCDGAAGPLAYVTNVSVVPRVRGAGVADRLMVLCLEHAAALGFGSAELRVGAANARALRFYARHGFARIADEGGELLLRRTLAAQGGSIHDREA